MSRARYIVQAATLESPSVAYFLEGSDFPPVTTVEGRQQLTAALQALVASIIDAGGTVYVVGVNLQSDLIVPTGQTAEVQKLQMVYGDYSDFSAVFDLVGPLEEA
ncbi:hypothetical protein SEA_WHABIGAIL7_8 [Mycobacterium phage Whabigail7]|uniref:Uncharacterized protein n=1 Tax=Mycobacterium phage Whabigail7 TaxID=2530156 RepID=A0A481VRT8_9CAUD|nr:hypothetical protein SEA_WHABIGAIL7_8 [Mycobacterium phage Whabigail7]